MASATTSAVGTLAAVRALLADDAVDIDARGPKGWSALHHATSRGNIHAVALLLESHAHVDAATHRGWTALHIASSRNVIRIVELLLDAHADPNASTSGGRTALHIATSRRFTSIVQRLLDAHANPNQPNDCGWAPLHKAVCRGDGGLVEMLLKVNADPNLITNRNWTALHMTIMENHAQIAARLLKTNADTDVATDLGWTALHMAVCDGNVPVVELLLEAGADPNVSTLFGSMPLHHAVSIGNSQVVEMLLQARANPNAVRTGEGTTPLDGAVVLGHVEAVELLIKANADLNVADRYGKTPLHNGAIAFDEVSDLSSRRVDVLRVLLGAGADMDATDNSGYKPLHTCIQAFVSDWRSTALPLMQVFVAFGAKWDTTCQRLVSRHKSMATTPGIRICMTVWARDYAEGIPFTEVPVEIIRRGEESTQTYVKNVKSSSNIVLRRKVCAVGSSCAGKTSFIRSITVEKPQLVHLDDRTIGIDHFPLHFRHCFASRKETAKFEVTFWDFAGQDPYQVAHSLFFSRRTMFLVFVDLEAFTVAFLQASLMAHIRKQEIQLMNEFIDRTVVHWIRMILARQPDAEFIFIVTKEDLLVHNVVTARLLTDALKTKLAEVETIAHEMRNKVIKEKKLLIASSTQVATITTAIVSCTSPTSVQIARVWIEEQIAKSDRSFQMPDVYTRALDAIVTRRDVASRNDVTTRLGQVFAPVDTLPGALHVEPTLCRAILQTLHDLGDVLWYEDLGVEMFRNTVILDPLLLIDFIRQIVNHKYTGQTIPHADLKVLPFWMGLCDHKQMKAVKQVLQQFHLVYSADEGRIMAWDSDLIVPAYWQTKTPAAWLFLGDILRINATRSLDGEATRVHWEFHFEFGLPPSLFDHFVVASVSPFFKFDAGPDWILYEEKEIAACRIMVGRDPGSLHPTVHVEVVVSELAKPKQVSRLWGSFRQLYGAFASVLSEYPGLVVSSFAWDDNRRKAGLKRLVDSTVYIDDVVWLPPPQTWEWFRELTINQERGTVDDDGDNGAGDGGWVTALLTRLIQRRGETQDDPKRSRVIA